MERRGRRGRRGRRYLLVSLLCCLSLFLYFNASSHSPSSSYLQFKHLPAANATLGFGAVLVVSRPTSPRREGLLIAANITEIDISIPRQPSWADENVRGVQAVEHSRIGRGSALAWLGHLNALRWFLDSGLETAIILEDDVDWDIHLRTSQIPKVAAAVRQLTNQPSSSPYYYGSPNDWDILYLGHCGDIFKPERWTADVPRMALPDDTLAWRKTMHPKTQAFLRSIHVKEKVRLVHKSIFPLCTFGYAVTRSSAHRLLHDVARREQDGGTVAYDVRILEACRDLGFRCWSANPELFHHMQAPSEIASVETGGGVDDEGRLMGEFGKGTTNLACGARSRDYFTRDPKTLEYLREEVGRKGHCLRQVLDEPPKRPRNSLAQRISSLLARRAVS
ncbi:hypothetical protein BJ546DRAFT_1060943 [Cryomyces antarcticus]